MRKLVIVNQSTGFLTVDLANACATSYDKVVLMAGRVSTIERPLDEQVSLSKIVAYNRTSAIRRILTWGIGTLQILIKLWLKYRDYEVMYITNPPMSYLCALLLRHPYSIVVYDVYPDALKNIGISERSWLYRLWVKWNKKLFSQAKQVFTITRGMQQLITQYVAKDRIKVVYNWSASMAFAPIPKKDNKFIKQHQLNGKFIVLYSGNIGYTHDVERIVEIAEQLQGDTQIHFCIVGEGRRKAELQRVVKEKNMQNVQFFPYQDAAMLPYSLASADLAVVTLNAESAAVSMPSKTYNLLAVGAPLLCIVSPDSELAALVDQANNGAHYAGNQLSEMVTFVKQLKNDKNQRELFSRHSQQASKRYTYKNAEQYVQALL